MTNFPVLNRGILKNDDQREFWDEITKGPRGFYSGGPESERLPDLYNAYMQFPELGRACFRIADAVRKSKNISGKMRELIVLTTSATLGAQVEFDFHVPFALSEGLSESLILAIKDGVTPLPFSDNEERFLHDANLQLLRTATLTEDLRRNIVDLWGYEGLMEIVATVASYIVVAYTTNIGKVALADDFSANPADLMNFFTGRESGEKGAIKPD